MHRNGSHVNKVDRFRWHCWRCVGGVMSGRSHCHKQAQTLLFTRHNLHSYRSAFTLCSQFSMTIFSVSGGPTKICAPSPHLPPAPSCNMVSVHAYGCGNAGWRLLAVTGLPRRRLAQTCCTTLLFPALTAQPGRLPMDMPVTGAAAQRLRDFVGRGNRCSRRRPPSHSRHGQAARARARSARGVP
jgi:hypothetical protein